MSGFIKISEIQTNEDCKSSGFCHCVVVVSPILAFQAVFVGTCLLTFRDNLSVPSSRVKQSKASKAETNRQSQNVCKELVTNAK